MKMRLRWSCGAGLLLVAIAGLTIAEEQQVAKVPKEVQQADKLLTNWLIEFKGQTAEEIRKAIGDPAEETTWVYKEKKEPLLKYTIGESSNMSLYFFEGRVVAVDLHLLPRSKP
jgi:hypothetical protein